MGIEFRSEACLAAVRSIFAAPAFLSARLRAPAARPLLGFPLSVPSVDGSMAVRAKGEFERERGQGRLVLGVEGRLALGAGGS